MNSQAGPEHEIDDRLDAQVRRRLVGTWTALLVLFTVGVLVWFFMVR